MLPKLKKSPNANIPLRILLLYKQESKFTLFRRKFFDVVLRMHSIPRTAKTSYVEFSGFDECRNAPLSMRISHPFN